MVERKPIRTRGKLSFSRYFQILKEGDFVAIAKEAALQPRFPARLQGITGIVEGKRGRAFIVKIKDGNKEKRLLIEPIHLKKIKTLNKIK
jgi:large subunit ribosomal protein L21e